MFSSSRSPSKTPLVNSFIKDILENESKLLQKLDNFATAHLLSTVPLYSYGEIPLKKKYIQFPKWS